jgi:MerR family copper efflux transcriptional regulator
MKSLTIGKVAQLAEVGVETVRFYEREGLINKPSRRESGYRQYPEGTAQRIRFIKRAKGLGFTLKEIKDLLALRIEPETTCEDIRRRAEAKIGDIEEKIRTLEKIKRSLVKLIRTCSGRGSVIHCPILEAMDD